MPLYLINSISNIENKKYLELGIHAGVGFDNCAAKNKIGVDIGWNPTYKMTTDQFFATVAKEKQLKFDIAFIDADHTWQSVLKDFNNCIKHMTSNSVIFMHDMYPAIELHILPSFCGTAYIILDAMLKMNYPDLFVQDFDCGVAMIFNPKIPISQELCDPNLSYQEFKTHTNNLKLHTVPEMVTLLSDRIK